MNQSFRVENATQYREHHEFHQEFHAENVTDSINIETITISITCILLRMFRESFCVENVTYSVSTENLSTSFGTKHCRLSHVLTCSPVSAFIFDEYYFLQWGVYLMKGYIRQDGVMQGGWISLTSWLLQIKVDCYTVLRLVAQQGMQHGIQWAAVTPYRWVSARRI